MLTETMLLLIYDFILVKMIAPPGLPGNGRAGLSVPTHARNLEGGGQPACDPDPSPQQPSWHVWGRGSANGTHLGIRSLDPSSAGHQLQPRLQLGVSVHPDRNSENG